jgi:ComF family protein
LRASRLASDLLSLLLPRGCISCGDWIPEGRSETLVCGRCRSRMPRAPWPRCPRCHLPLGTARRVEDTCRECREWPAALSTARYCYVLAPPADDLVHALKYEGWRELAPEMGQAMARLTLPGKSDGVTPVVVPVPTTRARLRRRGYNQAELLARGLADARNLHVMDALERSHGDVTQVSLHPSQRRANVKGAFAVRRGFSPRLRGTHVILVDDVLTTGSTAGAAAAELARAGASWVTLAAFARALPGYRPAGS